MLRWCTFLQTNSELRDRTALFTMSQYAIVVMLVCILRAYSAPHKAYDTCPGMSCPLLVNHIWKMMENLEYKTLNTGTRASNVTNCTLIGCNLNIFLKELKSKWNCMDGDNHPEKCAFYNLLRCMPHNCKIPKCNTDVHSPKKGHLYTILDKFLGAAARELKSVYEEGESCENATHR